MSPGNLYYHFADKQEIIRLLFAHYAGAHEGRWHPDTSGWVSLATLRANMAEGAALAWRYRFFEREILSLLRADPRLRAAYREVYERRLEQWQDFVERLVAQGLLRHRARPAHCANSRPRCG